MKFEKAYELEYEFETSDGELKTYNYEIEPEEIEKLGINPDEYDQGENYNILLVHFEDRAYEAFKGWDEQKDWVDCECVAKAMKEVLGDPYFNCEICEQMYPRYMESDREPNVCCQCVPNYEPEEQRTTHDEIV